MCSSSFKDNLKDVTLIPKYCILFLFENTLKEKLFDCKYKCVVDITRGFFKTYILSLS